MIVPVEAILFRIPEIRKPAPGLGDEAMVDVVEKIIKPRAGSVGLGDDEFSAVCAEVAVMHASSDKTGVRHRADF